jgi:hypothetical protein
MPQTGATVFSVGAVGIVPAQKKMLKHQRWGLSREKLGFNGHLSITN